jgi:hypothetical protein
VGILKRTELLLWGVGAASAVGWWLSTPTTAVSDLLGLWGALVAGVAVVGYVSSGILYRNRVWQCWLGVSVVGLGLNFVLLEDLAPSLVRDQLFKLGYLYPWFLLIAVGYLFTTAYEFDNKELANRERAIAGSAGVVCVGLFLAFWTSRPADLSRLFRSLTGVSVVPTALLALSYRLRTRS